MLEFVDLRHFPISSVPRLVSMCATINTETKGWEEGEAVSDTSSLDFSLS